MALPRTAATRQRRPPPRDDMLPCAIPPPPARRLMHANHASFLLTSPYARLIRMERCHDAVVLSPLRFLTPAAVDAHAVAAICRRAPRVERRYAMPLRSLFMLRATMNCHYYACHAISLMPPRQLAPRETLMMAE
ncbi:hypothetical protein AVEN_71584-1 [Araneus ventricosus]|uniref:Uncharacterized protein n=1 Tax=Araneus ventricosus TaxID=182803 RepID=A0A4Y2TAN7_ARAVE|nr:hypothetical protein AVEN_71584-1 [Araneus ventricosus]